MTATNTAILDSLEESRTRSREKETAERASAERTYWEILVDSSRTSAADKAAMAQAMRLLDKSIEDADADATLIETIRGKGELLSQSRRATEAYEKAKSDLAEYRSVTLIEIYRKARQVAVDKAVVVERLLHEASAMRTNAARLLDFLKENAADAQRIELLLKR